MSAIGGIGGVIAIMRRGGRESLDRKAQGEGATNGGRGRTEDRDRRGRGGRMDVGRSSRKGSWPPTLQ